MSTTPKALFNAQAAPTSIAKVYQVPTTVTATIIDKFTVTNTDSAAHAITIYLVPSGQSSGPSNMVTSSYSIAANSTYVVPDVQTHVLESGDQIFVTGASTLLTIRASGREIS